MPALSPTVRQLPEVPRMPGPVRLGVLVAAVAIAIAFFASAFAGSASAATTNRQVVTQSNSFLFINDDETFGSDETKNLNLSNLGWGVVSPVNQLQERGLSGCAGDEVRVEFTVRTLLSQTQPGFVTVKISAQLFEGTDCFSRSLDGSASLPSFTLAPGQTLGKTLIVSDGVGDYGQLHLVLTNAPA